MEINWIGEALDTLFSLLGKWGRWLNVRAKRTCFIVWSVAVTYWAIRDIYLHLYSQAIFCFVSLGFHLYGYYNWKKKDIGERAKYIYNLTSAHRDPTPKTVLIPLCGLTCLLRNYFRLRIMAGNL